MFRTCLTALLTLLFLPIFGQQTLNSEDELISSYDYLYNNPISLNDCTEAELSQIQFLSKNLIDAFLHFRNQNGPFIHLFELQVIPGWDLSICRKITPLVYVTPPINRGINLTNTFALFRLEQTIEKAAGFLSTGKNSSYQGSPMKEFFRLKNNPNQAIQIGFASQKDAGEPNHFDFLSAYLQIKSNKIFNKIILGDFSIQWGQGLLQAGGFSLGKTFESVKSTQKFHIGGTPYSSTSEYSFNRGVYFSKNLGSTIQWQFFISNKFLDAKVYSFEDQMGFRTIDSDGYHRNVTELANKSTIKELKWGNSLQFQVHPNHQIQVNMTSTSYNPNKIPSNLGYKTNDWIGQRFQLYSLSMTSQLHKLRLIEDLALQSNHRISFVQGAVWAASKKLDFSYLMRYFASGFYNPDGKALGENTKNENEIGLFLGNQWQFTKRKRLSSYLDMFYFPDIKYQVSQPKTYGWEVLSRYQMERKSQYHFYSQIKWTSKQEDFIKTTLQRTHDVQATADINYSQSRKWNFHSRLSAHFLNKDLTQQLGWMILHDIQLNNYPFQFYTRIAYIHTPSYDTRIYAYEQGLPNSFGLLSFFGQALRIATVIDWKIHKHLQLSTKIGRIHYIDRKEIGSGTDVIASNHKTDLSLQLIYQNL